MKTKCPICTKTKGRRNCLLNNNTLICSKCCANTRSPETCLDCEHYTQANKQNIIKQKQNGYKEFTLLIDAHVDKLVDNALILTENGQFEKALKQIDNLLNKHPDQYTVHYAKGYHCARTGQIEESIQHFKASIEIFPYFSEGYYNLSQSYKNLGQHLEFIDALMKAIEFASSTASFLKIAKEQLEEMTELIKAKTNLTLQDFIKLNETYSTAMDYMTQNNYPQAISTLQEVIKINPNHYQSHGNLALCQAMLGKKKRALEHLENALKIYPTYLVALQNQTMIHKMTEGEPLNIEIKDIHHQHNKTPQP